MALDDVAQTWFISEMGGWETLAGLKQKAESEIHELLNSGKIYPEDVVDLRKYINALEEILEEGDMPKYGDTYEYSKKTDPGSVVRKGEFSKKKAPKKATKKAGKKATKKT